MTYISDVCKWEREVAFLRGCCSVMKNNNFPFCVQSASTLQQKQTSSTPSSILSCPPPPPTLSSTVLTHLTALRFLQQKDTTPKIKVCESGCGLPVTIFTSPFTSHRFPCFCAFLPLPLRLILKAQHSLHASTVEKK